MTVKEDRKRLIEYLNYKDILIILFSWYLMIIGILITKELDLKHEFLTELFHFLFIISGRFILFSLLMFYLTSLYPIEFKDLGLDFRQFRKGIFPSLSGAVILFILVIVFINIPLSYNFTENFSPLLKINELDNIVTSLFPFTLIFTASIFISLSEQFIINVIIFELFHYTLFNRLISFILSALLYSVLLVEFRPERILLNTLVAMICLLLYWRKGSIIPSTLFMAAYYAIYISYIYGFSFIRF
ncbi:MAG: type II CAAX prenyl endopeptidase Rce1 family protein [Halanaerobiales bacterium]